MRASLLVLTACFGLVLCGCEGDYQGKPGDPTIDVKQTPDLDPRTDHDVDINPPDVDVDVQQRPGELPDVDVDVFKTPDPDTEANEPE